MTEGSLALFSSSRIIDLTHVITEKMPTWDEDEGFSQKQTHFIDVDGYVIHELNFKKAGIGTHFDSAAHFFQGKRWVCIITCLYLTLIDFGNLVRYMSIQLQS
jgi:kynurenine formamidase